MKRLIIVLCLLTLTFTLSAQDASPKYQLREPDVNTYMYSVADVLSIKDFGHGYSNTPGHILTEIIQAEIDYRYKIDNASFDALYEAYTAIFANNTTFFSARGNWNKAIIVAWLHENQPDLDEVSVLQFADYSIEVTSQDFNMDGRHEWVLHVVKENTDGFLEFNAYLVVTIVMNQLTLVDTPLHFTAQDFHYIYRESGSIEPQRFEDMNGDGLPEWVVAYGGVGGGHMTHGGLYILQWQDGKLVDLAPHFDTYEPDREIWYASPAGGGRPLFPYGVTVGYADVDKSGTTEIVTQQEQIDNWNCIWIQTRIFGWDTELSSYQLMSIEREYADSQGCAWRRAETAMWIGDYETAITEYEYGFSLPTTERHGNSISDPRALYEYAQSRLILAYALTGQTEKAAEVFSSFMPESTLMSTVHEGYNRIFNSTVTPIDACTVMYNAFYDYGKCMPETDSCFYAGYGLNAIVGETLENYGPPTSQLGAADPYRAGCWIYGVLPDITDSTLFEFDKPIPDQFIDLGIPLRHVFEADLNNDGKRDWIIWPEAKIGAYSYITDENTFKISSLGIQITPVSELYMQILPDDTNALIHSQVFQETNLDESWEWQMGMQLVPCLDADGQQITWRSGVLQIWTLENNHLKLHQTVPYCEQTEPAKLFTDNATVLHAWGEVLETNESIGIDSVSFVPIIYKWDVSTKMYNSLTSASTTLELTEVNTAQEPYPPSIYDIIGRFEQQQYIDMLDDITWLFSLTSEADAIAQLNYLRALAFEAMGFPDEALAEYIAIYEAAPESAWGMLAALHIEEID